MTHSVVSWGYSFVIESRDIRVARRSMNAPRLHRTQVGFTTRMPRLRPWAHVACNTQERRALADRGHVSVEMDDNTVMETCW